MRGIEFYPVVEGLKARDVIARGEAPGTSPPHLSPPCKGGTVGENFAVTNWPAVVVPPLQGGEKCYWDMPTQGFTLGYHMAGFQPSAATALKGRHHRMGF